MNTWRHEQVMFSYYLCLIVGKIKYKIYMDISHLCFTVIVAFVWQATNSKEMTVNVAMIYLVCQA